MWFLTGFILTMVVLVLSLCRVASRTARFEVHYGVHEDKSEGGVIECH